MRVDLRDARTALVAELAALHTGIGGLDDDALLAPSGCRGWNGADVLVHVHLGLQEMLLGVVGVLAGEVAPAPDLDAASYWRARVPTNDRDADRLDGMRFVQRVAASYRRPHGVVGHLGPTIDGVAAAVAVLPDTVVAFQGHGLAAGDFLATWAVELAVHHLDLGPAAGDPAAGALALARGTAETLLGAGLPPAWPAREAVLIATGRRAPDEHRLGELGAVAGRLPAFD